MACELAAHPATTSTHSHPATTMAGWRSYTDKVNLSFTISAVVCSERPSTLAPASTCMRRPAVRNDRPPATDIVLLFRVSPRETGHSSSHCSVERTAEARGPCDFLNHPPTLYVSCLDISTSGHPAKASQCRLSSGPRASRAFRNSPQAPRSSSRCRRQPKRASSMGPPALPRAGVSSRLSPVVQPAKPRGPAG